MNRSPLLPALLALALAPACVVGDVTVPGEPGGGDTVGENDEGGDDVGPGNGSGDPSDPGDDTPEPEPEDYALVVTPESADLSLGKDAQFTVALSSDNYEGPVTLSLSGVPDSWQVTVEPSEVIDLPLDGSVTATITVAVPTNGEAGLHDLAISASAEPGVRDGVASIAVENALVIEIADGTGNGHSWPADMAVNPGTAIRWVNYDTTSSHRIHGDQGIPHQDDDMGAAPAPGEAGGTYEITLNSAGVYYCHDHGANPVEQIQIAAQE